MEFLIIGIAVFFNVMVLKIKFERERYADLSFDLVVLVALSLLFSGSFGGLVVATVASALMSLYLLAFPPRLPSPLKGLVP